MPWPSNNPITIHIKSSPEYVIATFRVRFKIVLGKINEYYQHGKISGCNVDTKEKNCENLNWMVIWSVNLNNVTHSASWDWIFSGEFFYFEHFFLSRAILLLTPLSLKMNAKTFQVIKIPNIMIPAQAMMNFSVVSSTQLWKSKITQALPLLLAN